MNMTKYKIIEYYKSRVGRLFALKSNPMRLYVLRGGFMAEFGFVLTFETVREPGHVCARSNFLLFGQASDYEMLERKFLYLFPNQVVEVTND